MRNRTFRVLAGLLSVAAFLPLTFAPEAYLKDWYYLLCLVTTTPVFFYYCLTGRTLPLLAKLVDDDNMRLSQDVKPMLAKVSPQSFGCAVVFISLMLYWFFFKLK